MRRILNREGMWENKDRGRTGRTLGPLSELTSFSEAYHRERNTQHDGEGGERRVNSQSKIE